MSAIYTSTNITSTNTDVQLYQVPSGKTASVSVNMCNKTSGKIVIAFSISASNTPGAADYLDWNVEVLPGETYQRLGLVLPEQVYVFARTTISGLACQLYGFLETI